MSSDDLLTHVSAQYALTLERFVLTGGFPMSMRDGIISSSFGTEDDEQAWYIALHVLEAELATLLVQKHGEDLLPVETALRDVAIFYRTVSHFIRLEVVSKGSTQRMSSFLEAIDTSDTPWITEMNGLRAGISKVCHDRGWLAGAAHIDTFSFCGSLEALAFCVERVPVLWTIPVRRVLWKVRKFITKLKL